MYVPFRGAPDRVCMQELESRTESNLQALAAAAAPTVTVGIGDETPPNRSRAGHVLERVSSIVPFQVVSARGRSFVSLCYYALVQTIVLSA